MHQAIVEDEVEIVQFGTWGGYLLGIRRETKLTEKKIIFEKEELFKSEIAGVMGAGKTKFTVAVWSKIYTADVLKSAVKQITESLYFAEDVNLCMRCFFNEKLKRVSVRPEAYYVWNIGVGFSASAKSDLALIEDYKTVKLVASGYGEKYGVSDDIMYRIHLESVGILRVAVNNMILNHMERGQVEHYIAEISECEFIKTAKQFIQEYPGNPMWDGLRFLVSDYTPGEYYEYIENNLTVPSPKQKIHRLIRKIKFM